MTRLALLVLALLVSACEPVPHVTPEAVSDAYAEALAAEDTDRALALLEAQADAGDLHALAKLADVRSRGYLIGPFRDGATAVHLPIRTWPWSGPLAMRRFEAALQDSIAAGSPDALFLLADRHLMRRHLDGQWSEPDAESAREVYARLAEEDADPLRLAFLAQRLGDEDAFQRHLADGAAAGDPQACLFHHWETSPAPYRHGAAGLAASIDKVEACAAQAPRYVHALDGTASFGDRAVRSLLEQQALGNEAAITTLDSLRTLGVFERHPRLAALAAAPDA